MINTAGLEADYKGTGGYFSLTMDADNGNQTGYANSTFADISELDAGQVSDTALERAKLNRAQSEITPGKFDVVIFLTTCSEMLIFFVASATTPFSPATGVRPHRGGQRSLYAPMDD